MSFLQFTMHLAGSTLRKAFPFVGHLAASLKVLILLPRARSARARRPANGISASRFNNSHVGSGSTVFVTPTLPEGGADAPEELCQVEIRKCPASSAIKLHDLHSGSRSISGIQNKSTIMKHHQQQKPRQFPTLRNRTRLQGCGKSLSIHGCDGNQPPASNKAKISRSAASPAVDNMFLRKDTPSSRGSGFTTTIWSLCVPAKSGYHNLSFRPCDAFECRVNQHLNSCQKRHLKPTIMYFCSSLSGTRYAIDSSPVRRQCDFSQVSATW